MSSSYSSSSSSSSSSPPPPSSSSLTDLYFELAKAVFHRYVHSEDDPKGSGMDDRQKTPRLSIFEAKCALIALTNTDISQYEIKQKLEHFNRVREIENLALNMVETGGVTLDTFLLILGDMIKANVAMNDLERTVFSEADRQNHGCIGRDVFLEILSKSAPMLCDRRGENVFKSMDLLNLGDKVTFPNFRACSNSC